MTGERARLFVALELPEEAVAALLSWRERVLTGVRGLRLVAPESLHVTLCFLGSVAVSEIAPIASACAGPGAGHAITLTLGAPVWLPRRRPSVLAVSVDDPSGALVRTQGAVADALEAGGWYDPEGRPFFAHVTVARVGRGERIRAVELAPPAPLEFAGSVVTLFRSRTAPGGSRYEPVSRRSGARSR